jgi:hypothetical protein
MITVTLTSKEKAAFDMVGMMHEPDAETMIKICLWAKGATNAQVEELAPSLAAAALSAQRKIREATSYEIVIVD